MPTRRDLLKTLGIATAASALPSKAFSSSVNTKPIVVSTWKFGLDANAAAWKILSSGGRALDAVEEGLRQHFFEHQKVNELRQGFERDIVAGNLSPYVAAHKLLAMYCR